MKLHHIVSQYLDGTSLVTPGYDRVTSQSIYMILKISKRYNLQIIQVYPPTSLAEEVKIEQEYEDITTFKRCENTHFTIVMDDFNAKVRNHNEGSVSYGGNFRLGLANSY